MIHYYSLSTDQIAEAVEIEIHRQAKLNRSALELEEAMSRARLETTAQLTVERTVEQRDLYLQIACAVGGVLVVIVIILTALICRMKRNHSEDLKKMRRDQVKKMWIEDTQVHGVQSGHDRRLGRNEHPDVRDKFGMDEIFDVTAGEGQDLVRIARPLVTGGEQMGIQTTGQRTEGDVTVTDGMTPGTD